MAYLIGPVVAILGVIMVALVIRTKARAKKSLYASLRQDRERKVREIREKTLVPKSKAAAAAAKAAPLPSSSASIPAVAQQSRPVWDVSPTMPAKPAAASPSPHVAPPASAPVAPPVPPPAGPAPGPPAPLPPPPPRPPRGGPARPP